MNISIELVGVTKSFGSALAVGGVDLQIAKGEIFSLLGPSGCGKTTLLRMVAGFERPDSGRILLDGEDITRLPPDRRPLNTVFQNYALFPHLTAAENIAFGLRAEGRRRSEIEPEVERALELIQLSQHASKKPAQLSGGQKQRVAIARALVKRPQVLLLDEPLAALDLKLRQRMLLELDRIHDEVGITFVFVTHDQDEAMGISDRIAVMNRGEIEQVGTPSEVYEMPRSPFVASFIGDTNFLPATVCEPDADGYCTLDAPGFGRSRGFMDKPFPAGAAVTLAVRPEKLNISQDPPPPAVAHNQVTGVVEDVIYLGSGTRYWVRSGEHRLHVVRQHNRCLLEERPITWDDTVWLTWHADDVDVLEQTPETGPGPGGEAAAGSGRHV